MESTDVHISLGEPKLKEISEALSNTTCVKMLRFLAGKASTVSEMSRELSIPITTAEYNCKKLLTAGLIKTNEHWWSVKGKKMPIYEVSNKKIIISPATSSKKYGVVAGVMGILTAGVYFLERSLERLPLKLSSSNTLLFANEAGSAPVTATLFNASSWEWFLIGSAITILLFFVVSLLNKREDS